MEITGVPLHPLVVHAAVVLGPLAALAALVYLVPPWHDRLRWPMVVLALLAAGSIWAAYLTGEDFFDSARFDGFSGEALEKIEHHVELAETLRLVVSGFAIVAVLKAFAHRRGGFVGALLSVLLLAGAVATLVWVVLTGDAGAQAVWG
ncbi:DUF2231 domain-containing protein [Nocardioides sp. InS609-2]|uniref:DUF2231 domain-containing protein n=1 Tax=Nocardioides sp. InS609-2 TaxID=2760705 RepID=UPI0020BF5E71|nr:DUF2231 domain-containing protein [Nocardioides sp. InS609-2]